MFGLELLDYWVLLIVQWVIVFIVNVIPAMAPPTWAVLSFFNITRSQNIWVLVIVGVSASTIGRFCLAKLSGYLTNQFVSKEKKREFIGIGEKLKGKSWEKFGFTVLFALSPLPSNALFIAFGATKTRLREVLAGFVVGRSISYLFLIFTTEKVFSSLGETMRGNTNLWTILVEVIGVIAILAFFKFDWAKMINFEGNDNNKSKKRWAHHSANEKRRPPPKRR
ncbi:MAG: hypothetical protein NTY48_05355 [Candidatus Diapherotrites archaeon]|nr:hypothetical protein [Candidatus Diapherotrites archaeon]